MRTDFIKIYFFIGGIIMTKNQKKDFFLTIFNAIIGLIVMYFSKIFLNDLEMLLLSSGAIVLVILPVQVRKKKQRKLIAAYLNNIDTTLQENIYKVTRITTAQLKNYTVLGNGIASSKLYKIEEILSKM